MPLSRQVASFVTTGAPKSCPSGAALYSTCVSPQAHVLRINPDSVHFGGTISDRYACACTVDEGAAGTVADGAAVVCEAAIVGTAASVSAGREKGCVEASPVDHGAVVACGMSIEPSSACAASENTGAGDTENPAAGSVKDAVCGARCAQDTHVSSRETQNNTVKLRTQCDLFTRATSFRLICFKSLYRNCTETVKKRKKQHSPHRSETMRR